MKNDLGYDTMKIKIIADSNIKKLECKVNSFIKDRCIINISHELAVLNICNKCNKHVNILIIVILYGEYDHCGYLDLNSIMDLKK